MEFEKYQHVERLGNTEVIGILDGMCYIFPKIDGTNASVWYDGEVKAGSRNRELTLEKDNAGFYKAMIEDSNIKAFFNETLGYRLYGEWLVPHTLKTYTDEAWRKFYIFDVMHEGEYVPYEEYSVLLDMYELNYIQPICKVENPTEERLIQLTEKNTFLIRDGAGVGEGVVIKNYSFINKYGRVTWAKIVRNEFKEKNKKAFGIAEIKETEIIEKRIVNKYITSVLVNKEFDKIENWTNKKIPHLLGVVYYCLVKEELWEALKFFKNPIIDFNRLNRFTNLKIKELKPELF